MQTTRRSLLEKRMVAGITVSMLAALLGTVCVAVQGDPQTAESAAQSPFWSADAPASNLAVVELYRSGATSCCQGSR